jgi:hypothetical protein
LLEARMGNRGKREFIQVLRLMEAIPREVVVYAVTEAIRLGAIGFDAVKQIALARVERRPARLDLTAYPRLPKASCVSMVARECAHDGVDHPRYLPRLVELELIDRERRVIDRRIKQARFPATKSLDTFDFTAIPSLKMLVLELARGTSILRRENVIALGNSGTGKTHVALALGLAACQKGSRSSSPLRPPWCIS